MHEEAAMTESVDLEALIRGRRSRRRWLLPAAALVALGVAAIAFLTVQPSDSDVVVEPEPVEATRGRLTSTVDLSGSAAAARSDELSFGTAGTVAVIDVQVGDRVSAGQLLAQLDARGPELTLAEAQLTGELRRAELAELQATDATALAAIAAARQSVVAADGRLVDAGLVLADLLVGPTDAVLDAARRDIVEHEIVLLDAREALAALEAGPTAGEVAEAELFVARAEAELLAAADDLTVASGLRATSESLASFLAGDAGASGDVVIALLLAAPGDALVAGAAESAAAADFQVVRLALDDANVDLSTVLAGAAAADIEVARRELGLAEAALEEVETEAQDLVGWQLWSGGTFDVLDAGRTREVDAARAEIAEAEAALARERADLTELLSGPGVSDVLGAELAVARAETALADAEEALRDTTLLAPFEGVVEAVEVERGDSVSANAIAFVVTDLVRIVVELTVTEGDLFDLEPGLVGLATFDAIDGVDYPVRLTRLSSLPVIEQGVVTYAVQAEVLPVSELGGVAEELSALRDGATAGFGGGAGGGAAAGAGGGGRGGAAGAAGFLDQLLTGVELPEGVAAQEVLLAFASGEPLPDGVTLPEGFELPEQLQQAFASGRFAGGGGARRGGAGADAPAGAEAPGRLLPAPGMTASVTLLAEVRPEAVLVPVAVVRQLGADFIVTVPAADGTTQRVTVTVGSSDGTSVEILEGVEAGDTLLIGAETEGVPFSATQQTQNAAPGGFGGFGGGGFGGGGGGGGGRGGFGGGGGGAP